MKHLVLSSAMLLVCAYLWYQITTGPALVGAAAPAPQTTPQPQVWATLLCAQLGNTSPSADMLLFLEAWHRSEGGSAAFNPFNSTQVMDGSTDYNVNNGFPVQNYGSVAQGIAATVQTLRYDQPGYADIAAGIATNDVDRALQGLRASPWGSNADLAERVYHELRTGTRDTSAGALLLGGDCQYNIVAALNANGGALQHVTLQPGTMFSFNATMGSPARVDYRMCAGVPGGGWCNLAARYSQLARAVGLQPRFVDHGIDLGAGRENAVAIWNVDGTAGFDNGAQDLVIENTLDHAITFIASSTPQGVTVEVQ